MNSFSFSCSWSVKLRLSRVFMTQWRVYDMAYSFRTLFLVFLASCDFTVAHVALTYPPARKYDLDFLDNSRTKGPCGMPKGEYSFFLIGVRRSNADFCSGTQNERLHDVRTLTVAECFMSSWQSLCWSRNYCHFMTAEIPLPYAEDCHSTCCSVTKMFYTVLFPILLLSIPMYPQHLQNVQITVLLYQWNLIMKLRRSFGK